MFSAYGSLSITVHANEHMQLSVRDLDAAYGSLSITVHANQHMQLLVRDLHAAPCSAIPQNFKLMLLQHQHDMYQGEAPS